MIALRYIFLTILILLSASTSVANNSDTQCKDVVNLNLLMIEKGVDLKCEQTKSIDLFVGQVLGLSPIPIKDFVLKISHDHLKKSVNTGSGVIMGLTKRFSMSIQEQAVLAHELGHVIFDAYFYQNFEPTKRERELNTVISKKLKPIYSLLDKSGECSTEQCKSFLQEISIELAPLQEERDKLSEQNEKLSDFLQEFVRPYNELVADAVAALHFEKPEIMNKTLSVIHPKRDKDKVDCRSFLIETHSVYAYTDHCAFSGLRGLILEKILIPGINSGEKVQALEALLKLVTQDIIKHYESLREKYRNEQLDGGHSILKGRRYITELNSLYELLRGSLNEQNKFDLSIEERRAKDVHFERRSEVQNSSSSATIQE